MGDLTTHFSKSEFACKCGCGLDNINIDLVISLEKFRLDVQRPVEITSGVRCRYHNKSIKSSSTSSHIIGLAADIRCSDSKERFRLLNHIFKYFSRVGIADSFIHVDIDNNKPQELVWVY